jgi:hypothetical protein
VDLFITKKQIIIKKPPQQPSNNMPSSPTPETVKMTTPDAFKNLPEPFESYLSRKSNGRMGSQIEKPGTEAPQTDSAVSQEEITREPQDR